MLKIPILNNYNEKNGFGKHSAKPVNKLFYNSVLQAGMY